MTRSPTTRDDYCTIVRVPLAQRQADERSFFPEQDGWATQTITRCTRCGRLRATRTDCPYALISVERVNGTHVWQPDDGRPCPNPPEPAVFTSPRQLKLRRELPERLRAVHAALECCTTAIHHIHQNLAIASGAAPRPDENHQTPRTERITQAQIVAQQLAKALGKAATVDQSEPHPDGFL